MHIIDVRKTSRQVLKAAVISDLRLHDLQHHYASVLASSCTNLLMIGSLLGHRSASSTARYTKLFLDSQREASERAAAIITTAGPGTEPPPPGQRDCPAQYSCFDS